MATAPNFAGTPRVSWTTNITAANTAKDGTGTVAAGFTAGASGSRIEYIVGKPRGANIASLVRVFVNNGLTNATAANNSLLLDATTPAVAALSEVAVMGEVWIPGNGLVLQANYVLNFVLATAVAAGWHFTVVGADF